MVIFLDEEEKEDVYILLLHKYIGPNHLQKMPQMILNHIYTHCY
jgi:hypothetical protein